MPSSLEPYQMAVEEGLISIFMKAGCCVTNPNCGPCLGMSCGVIYKGRVCLSTTNRNYKDRMGEGGMVHLASPATAAFSAMHGEILEPPYMLCDGINDDILFSDKASPYPRLRRTVPTIDYEKLCQTYFTNFAGATKEFSGKPFFIRKEKINTDEIIKAHYLTKVDKKAFGEYCLDVLVVGPAERKNMFSSRILVGDIGFGDGSSREQAPWALEGAGLICVIAKSFERIFEDNFFNTGNLPITLPAAIVDELHDTQPGRIEVVWNTPEGEQGCIKWGDGKKAEFPISEVQKNTIRKGGSIGLMFELAAKLQKEGKI